MIFIIIFLLGKSVFLFFFFFSFSSYVKHSHLLLSPYSQKLHLDIFGEQNTKTTKQFPNYAAAASSAMSSSHEMLLSEPVKDVMKWQMVCLLSSSIKFSCGCALNCFPLFALDVDGCAGWGWFARSAQSPKTREMETERSELLSGVWHNKHNWSQASQRA